MLKAFFSFLILSVAYSSFGVGLPELKTQLGLVSEKPCSDNLCRLYIVYHGSDDEKAPGDVQGAPPVSLNESGIQRMETMAQELASLKASAIYIVPKLQARQAGQILQKAYGCPLFEDLGLGYGLSAGAEKMARKIIPELRGICLDHPGSSAIIVTDEEFFKLAEFLCEKPISTADVLLIVGDHDKLYFDKMLRST